MKNYRECRVALLRQGRNFRWRDCPTTITATAVQPLGNKSPPLADRSTMRPIKSIRHIGGEKYRQREFRHYNCMFFNLSAAVVIDDLVKQSVADT